MISGRISPNGEKMAEYTVIPTDKFNDDVEYYVKKKKYKHIDEDIKSVTDELEKGNLIGAEIPHIQVETGEHTFKVRTANTDTKSGKSNGYRIIYYVIKDDAEIYLVTIYSKKDSTRIPSDKDIIRMIAEYCM